MALDAKLEQLEFAFHEAMLQIYTDAKDQCKYNATRFLQMVTEDGGLAAAKKLVRAPHLSDGFEALYLRGRLDLTIEAVILQEKWRELFSEEELSIARKRLEDLHYFDKSSSSTGSKTNSKSGKC